MAQEGLQAMSGARMPGHGALGPVLLGAWAERGPVCLGTNLLGTQAILSGNRPIGGPVLLRSSSTRDPCFWRARTFKGPLLAENQACSSPFFQGPGQPGGLWY